MADLTSNATIVEVAHASDMQAELRRKLAESHQRDGGRMHTVRAAVLSMVVNENYERAQEELRAYIGSRVMYPGFQDRVFRFVEHGCGIIQAIQTKRRFPGVAQLSLSKQQELHERIIEHFEELKDVLKQIERVEREIKLEDIRSTVWVVQALSLVGIAILAALFYIDWKTGTLSSTVTVTTQVLDSLSTWIVTHLPF